uniref:Secreted protein n=1 Tax=Steinernema glaseri TaxID=37863 RepID=A0A1I7YHM2_9BILA
MWSVLALLLLVQQVLAGIFIPIHGYEKNVQKREPLGFAAVCQQLLRNAEANVAYGQRREDAYANVPSVCFESFAREK